MPLPTTRWAGWDSPSQIEVTLQRRLDNHVAGFQSKRAVRQRRDDRPDGTAYDVGKIIVTIDSASDLWDPNDQSD